MHSQPAVLPALALDHSKSLSPMHHSTPPPRFNTWQDACSAYHVLTQGQEGPEALQPLPGAIVVIDGGSEGGMIQMLAGARDLLLMVRGGGVCSQEAKEACFDVCHAFRHANNVPSHRV